MFHLELEILNEDFNNLTQIDRLFW